MSQLTPKQALLVELADCMQALGYPPFSDKKTKRMCLGVVRVQLDMYRRLLAERGA